MCARELTDLESLKRKRANSLNPPPAEMSVKESPPAAQPPSKKSVAMSSLGYDLALTIGKSVAMINRDRLPIAEYNYPEVNPNLKSQGKMKIKLPQTRKAIGTKLLMRESQSQYHEGEVVGVEQGESFTSFQCKFPASKSRPVWRLHAEVLEMAQAYLDHQYRNE